jgi:Ca2+-binding EF-hand superfamily protein
MKSSVFGAVVLALALPSAAAAQRPAAGAMRFQGMDTNHDGVITREEWRGNDRSFRNHDWNGDGKLSGDEVRPGASRSPNWDDRDLDWSIERDDDFSAARFRVLDHNRDGRLARSEWHGTRELFTRLDSNRDGFLNAAEFTGGDDYDREDRFADLDTNRDGRISRDEWHGSRAVFDALDANRDGVLVRQEAVGDSTGPEDEFRSVDVNGDGVVSVDEWHWNRAAFDRLDANRDRRLTRQEWDNAPQVAVPAVTAAFRAGYERGRQDGVQAGREDKPHGWDLEGQRELETADAGYQPSVGARVDYQAGYRAGFRRGYREGFTATQ